MELKKVVNKGAEVQKSVQKQEKTASTYDFSLFFFLLSVKRCTFAPAKPETRVHSRVGARRLMTTAHHLKDVIYKLLSSKHYVLRFR